MRLSVGVLYTSQEILSLITRHSLTLDILTEYFRGEWVAPANQALDLSIKCGWISVDNHYRLIPSPQGEILLNEIDYQVRLRTQLVDFINSFQPPWSKLIPKGRIETLRCLDSDTLQCFKESGLASPKATEDIVHWWDTLASSSRGQKADILLEIGREGERLSLEYERNRTGKEPRWHSIESNLSGFDLISVVSDQNSTNIFIEVKASCECCENGRFFLSRNEWEVAISAKRYFFHLWANIKTENQKIAIISPAEMAKHIPVDSGSGRWQEIILPLKSFATYFK